MRAMPEEFHSIYRQLLRESKRGYLVSSHKNLEVNKCNDRILRVVEAYRFYHRTTLACIYMFPVS